jgi:hypothetical protein
MSKKDLELIAAILKRHKVENDSNVLGSYCMSIQWQELVDAFTAELRCVVPGFKTGKFLAACGKGE